MLDDFAAEFMPEHDVACRVHEVGDTGAPGDRRQRIGMMERVQVGPADAARQRPDQHLASRRSRVGDVVEYQRAAAPDHCLHDRSRFLGSTARLHSPRKRPTTAVDGAPGDGG